MSIVAGLAVIAASSGWLVWNSYIKPVPLFARKCTPKDVSEMSRFLTNKGIEHTVDGSEELILIHPWKRGQATSLLAQAHLPKRQAVTESGPFPSATELKNRRHLEQEQRITTQVKQISGVVDAEVIIAVPADPSLFKDEKLPTQASVTLHLEQGVKLNETQIESMMSMVSSSFPDLKSENVTIIDANSGLEISRDAKDTDDTGSLAQNRLLAQELRIAESHRRAAEQVLSGLGADKFRVSVICVLDSSVEETNQRLHPGDPSSETGSNKKREEMTKDENGTHYVSTIDADRKDPDVVGHHVVRKTPKIESISAAVSFDNLNDEMVAKFKPALKAALGIKEERGDQFEIANYPFSRGDISTDRNRPIPQPVPQAPESTLPLLLSGLGLTVVAVGLLAWSKQNRRNSSSRMVGDMQTTQPNTTLVDLLDDKMRVSKRSEATQVAQQLQTITEMSPDAMAKLLKTSWLNKSGGQ
jgi:flagellar biosynthesis/type III secretory pathway M-ring protein FliF/YscJ